MEKSEANKKRPNSSYRLFKNTSKYKKNNENINEIIQKSKQEKELEERIEEYKKNEEDNLLFQNSSNTRDYIISLFSKSLFAELFFAWSRDCEDQISIENAKFFREELILRKNNDDRNFDFHSMRVSKNFLVSFTGNLSCQTINKLDLSDNLINDICLHNIKSLISTKKLVYLNLSSNMISTEGLKIIHNEITNSESLSYLNLGIYEGSFRRNNLSGDGGLILARILLTNESLKTLILQDNELGEDAGDKIGSSLIQNKTLVKLKIAENKLKNKGAKSIIENGGRLKSLDLSDNEITPELCYDIQKFLISSDLLEEFIWNSNNIGIKGIRIIIEGVQGSKSLKSLSLQNTNIGNLGIKIISEGLIGNKTLESLDVSSNSVSFEGFIPLCNSILTNNIKIFKCRNNLLGDECMKYFANTVLDIEKDSHKIKLQKFDFSSSKIYDQGLIYIMSKLKNNTTIISVKLKDNYFTHEVDSLLLEFLEPNKSIINLDLDKNRLSLLCLKKIKDLINRNRKFESDKEPNRLLVEVYRLRYENTKLEEMKESLRFVENNVEKIKLNKNDLRQEYENFKRSCDEESEQINKKVNKNIWNLEKLTKEKEEYDLEFEESKVRNYTKLKELNIKKEGLINKKNQLEDSLKELKEKFLVDESKFIEEYDKLRTEILNNQEKIKFYNDNNDIFKQIKDAEKKIKELKRQRKKKKEDKIKDD